MELKFLHNISDPSTGCKLQKRFAQRSGKFHCLIPIFKSYFRIIHVNEKIIALRENHSNVADNLHIRNAPSLMMKKYDIIFTCCILMRKMIINQAAVPITSIRCVVNITDFGYNKRNRPAGQNGTFKFISFIFTNEPQKHDWKQKAGGFEPW
jgi:hypothetical protein